MSAQVNEEEVPVFSLASALIETPLQAAHARKRWFPFFSLAPALIETPLQVCSWAEEVVSAYSCEGL
jgi:hypothetical protein